MNNRALLTITAVTMFAFSAIAFAGDEQPCEVKPDAPISTHRNVKSVPKGMSRSDEAKKPMQLACEENPCDVKRNDATKGLDGVQSDPKMIACKDSNCMKPK